MEKFLIIRFSSFGDVILSTAFVKALKSKYPESEIYFLTKSVFADVFKNNPDISKVFTIETSSFFEIYQIATEINRLAITKIFDLSRNFRSLFATFFIDADTESISKNSFSRRMMVLFKIFPKKFSSILEKYSRFCGINSEILKPQIYLDLKEKEHAKKILKYDEKQKYVGINPSAKWKNKKWVLEKYVYLIDELLKRDFKVVIFGDENDIEYNSEIVDGLSHKKNLINLTNKLKKRELFGVVSLLNILFTTDSAIMHIAQSFCVPVVAIFGATIKQFGFWHPNPKDVLLEVKLNCRPCHLHGGDFCKEGHFKCMKNIDEKLVLGNILLGLKNNE